MVIPCAVFVIAHQRVLPAGKLHADLMAPPRVQADAYQAGLALRQAGEGEAGILYALAEAINDEDLVLPCILEEQVGPVAFFLRRTMDEGDILLHHRSLLNGAGKDRRGSLRPGIDHHAAHVQVKAVDGIALAAQYGLNQGRHGGFRIHADGLEDDGQIFIVIEELHTNLPEIAAFMIPHGGHSRKQKHPESIRVYRAKQIKFRILHPHPAWRSNPWQFLRGG